MQVRAATSPFSLESDRPSKILQTYGAAKGKCQAHTVGEAEVWQAAVHTVDDTRPRAKAERRTLCHGLSASFGAAAGTAMCVVALIALMVAVAPETSRSLHTPVHGTWGRGTDRQDSLQGAASAPNVGAPRSTWRTALVITRCATYYLDVILIIQMFHLAVALICGLGRLRKVCSGRTYKCSCWS